MTTSNYAEAMRAMDIDTIRIVLQLQREYYMHWGSWPTVQQIASELRLHDMPLEKK